MGGKLERLVEASAWFSYFSIANYKED